MVNDPFLERLRAANKVRTKISKLMAVYEKHPDTPEGRTAKAKADELQKQLDTDIEEPKISKVKPNIPSGFGFGAMAGAFKKQFPGVDDEDYSKYAGKTVEPDED